MRKAGWGLKAAATFTLLYLNIPILFVFLYAFTTDESGFQFPPPGYTTQWFEIAWTRVDIRNALTLSLAVATAATAIALVTGTLAAAAVWRSRFFGRETLSLFIILPIALPGIITGISLRSAMQLGGLDFSFWTVVIGHATFCVAVAYNNIIARMRRTSPNRAIPTSRFYRFMRPIYPSGAKHFYGQTSHCVIATKNPSKIPPITSSGV
jgi:putative spermidine/putrescine transport system permease protein